MPHEALKRLEELVSGERAEFMVPASAAEVATQAMIEAMRAQADVLRGIVGTQETFRADVREISETLHSIDKRLHAIESGPIKRDVQRNHERLNRHSTRLDALEAAEDKREGASRAATAVKDYGPWMVAIVAGIVALVQSGALKL